MHPSACALQREAPPLHDRHPAQPPGPDKGLYEGLPADTLLWERPSRPSRERCLSQSQATRGCPSRVTQHTPLSTCSSPARLALPRRQGRRSGHTDTGGEGRRRASADRAEGSGQEGTADGARPHSATRRLPPAHPSRLLSGLNLVPLHQGPGLETELTGQHQNSLLLLLIKG